MHKYGGCIEPHQAGKRKKKKKRENNSQEHGNKRWKGAELSLWGCCLLQHKIMMMKMLHMPASQDEPADNDEAWWQTNKSKASKAQASGRSCHCCWPATAPATATTAAPAPGIRQQSSSLPQHSGAHCKTSAQKSSALQLQLSEDTKKRCQGHDDGSICVCGMCDNHVYARRWNREEN